MYQYPAGHRMAEHTFYSLYSVDDPRRHLVTVPLSEHDVQQEIGAHVVIGGSVIERFRIRTRCGQARVVIAIFRYGALVSCFDLRDGDVKLTSSVTFDAADMDAYFASLGISKTL